MAARWLRIDLEPAARERGYAAIRISGAGPHFVAVPGALPLLALLHEAVDIDIAASEGRIAPLPFFGWVLANLRLWLGVWKGAELRFPGVTLLPSGSRAATRRYRKHIEASRRHASAWDGPLLAAHPELVEGWPFAAARPATSAAPPRLAVAVHLYYTELWDEIETLLGRWRVPFRLFLTLNAADAELEARAKEAFPGARVRVVENRGRDVRPFLIWLEEGAFGEFDLVCKLHGKRSLGGGRLPAFGDVLRRVNFHDLIADPERVEALVARFHATPDLGLVGSARFLSASTAATPRDVLGANRAEVVGIAGRLKAPLTEPEFDFFEGTMFWLRPAALAPLASLRLSAESFAPEAGRTDGAIEHALERLFNHVARSAGYRADATIAP